VSLPLNFGPSYHRPSMHDVAWPFVTLSGKSYARKRTLRYGGLRTE